MKVIDAEKEKLEVKYCIPNWLREEQMKMSCSRFHNRIQPVKKLRNEPIAIVCFGPSLNQTWEKVKDFKFVMSCSGSHKYLKERGIIPDFHVEVDPRAHKVELIGADISHKTEFLMASCCHPKVFDHLVAHNAKITLWHTYSGEPASTMPLVYPKGEWISTGGANVGLRALVLARILGFTELHIFGMDGSFDKDSELKHAAFHPNIVKKYVLAEYERKQYATTPAFLECARGTFHELRQLSDVNVTFYGEGLIQEMAKKKLPEMKKKDKADIAFFIAPTISAEYVKQNKLLHESTPSYGVSALQYLDTIKKLYEVTDSKSLLDYGCGKGLLAKNLDFPIWEYDPAIENKNSVPRPVDLLVCIDVLEHIEPEYLDSVLVDIARCIKKVGYLVISTQKAAKTLPDGRNTHLIQEGKEWWFKKLSEYLIVPENGIKEKDKNLHIIVSPKSNNMAFKQRITLFSKEEIVV